MVTETDEWLGDFDTMVCQNKTNKIVVELEKKGKAYIGKIKYLPIELMVILAGMKDGELLIKKLVMDAEEAFTRAYLMRNEEIIL
jgi:hypothetical protein